VAAKLAQGGGQVLPCRRGWRCTPFWVRLETSTQLAGHPGQVLGGAAHLFDDAGEAFHHGIEGGTGLGDLVPAIDGDPQGQVGFAARCGS
jgi:hypothetical protein